MAGTRRTSIGIPLDQSLKPFSVTRFNQPPRATTSPQVQQAVSSGLTGLVSSYNQAYGQAKGLNERRYRQLLSIANQERAQKFKINTQQLGIADQTTGQRAADIRSDAFDEQSNIGQRLARVGMGNTTVGSSLRGGVDRRMQGSLNRLADTMQQTKLGLLQRRADIKDTRSGIIERRTDAYPDQSMLAGLVSSIGTGQRGDLIPSTLGALSKLRLN